MNGVGRRCYLGILHRAGNVLSCVCARCKCGRPAGICRLQRAVKPPDW